MKSYGQRLVTLYRRQGSRPSQEKKFKKANWLSEEALQIAVKRIEAKIKLIIFFAAKNGEALYSQQKQDWELTVAQIVNSLLPNSDLNSRK